MEVYNLFTNFQKKTMRLSHINNVTVIAITSLVLAVLGFILDLYERKQDVKVNTFEILMMTAIIFTILCSLYIFGYLIFKLISKLRRVKT
jgi:hypothetical protein